MLARLQSLARTPATADGPLPELAAALATRKLTLTAPLDAAVWLPDLRRAALVLGIAAADLATPGGAVTLTLATDSGRRELVAAVPASPRAGGTESIGITLARRVIEAAGGRLTLAVDGGNARLAADLLDAGRADPPLDRSLRA